MTERKLTRCAIYTRKSSEEGLDQAFNSLDAQREACAAYILSQAGEGWKELTTRYDDGGYSGGSLERPALHQLLTDISEGKVDVVVVYKVDRLTRALSDFAKIVEILDSKKASFVSVTQSFNTTTSMGRLTLNVLLSFAQFAREVTGERIRDKIAASRRKGMWMGGCPPLGYDVQDRKLVAILAESEIVRNIFERYLALGSVGKLLDELREQKIQTKSWTSAAGIKRGGQPFNRGSLYHLLKNRVYLGEVVHKAQSYPGEHVAILDQVIWDRAQALLASNSASNAQRSVSCAEANPLLGLLRDDRGNLMTPTYTSKKMGRHRYYVSQALLQGRKADAGSLPRVSAPLVEGLIEGLLPKLLSSRLVQELTKDCKAERLVALRRIVSKLEITHDRITFIAPKTRTCPFNRRASRSIQCTIISSANEIRASLPIRMVVRGGERLLIDPTANFQRRDETLVRALARGWRYREILERGDERSLPLLARREGIHPSYLQKLLHLAFLEPSRIENIVNGRDAETASLTSLLASGSDLRWMTSPTAGLPLAASGEHGYC